MFSPVIATFTTKTTKFHKMYRSTNPSADRTDMVLAGPSVARPRLISTYPCPLGTSIPLEPLEKVPHFFPSPFPLSRLLFLSLFHFPFPGLSAKSSTGLWSAANSPVAVNVGIMWA